MTETTWTRDEVEGFAAKLSDFYTDLSPAARRIFADMLQDGVRETGDVAGFAMTGETIPGSVITAAVTEYLMARAEDAV